MFHVLTLPNFNRLMQTTLSQTLIHCTPHHSCIPISSCCMLCLSACLLMLYLDGQWNEWQNDVHFSSRWHLCNWKSTYKDICIPHHLSKMFQTLPPKQFQLIKTTVPTDQDNSQWLNCWAADTNSILRLCSAHKHSVKLTMQAHMTCTHHHTCIYTHMHTNTDYLPPPPTQSSLSLSHTHVHACTHIHTQHKHTEMNEWILLVK